MRTFVLILGLLLSLPSQTPLLDELVGLERAALDKWIRRWCSSTPTTARFSATILPPVTRFWAR
jgi:hypothetical protein